MTKATEEGKTMSYTHYNQAHALAAAKTLNADPEDDFSYEVEVTNYDKDYAKINVFDEASNFVGNL